MFLVAVVYLSVSTIIYTQLKMDSWVLSVLSVYNSDGRISIVVQTYI